jgi:ribosome-associated toxin RatA of RatAB toxin-antitoxin module
MAYEVVGVGHHHAQALGGPVILADHIRPFLLGTAITLHRRWGAQAANRLACAIVAELTQSSIVITADPADIMDIIADVEAYQEWIPGIDKVQAHGVDGDGRPEEATFTGNLGMMKDTYTVAYDWAETEVSWHLTKGEMLHDLQGTYTCTDLGDGTTRVEYSLAVEFAVPVIGMLRRRGEKVIVDSALKGLKRRAED